MFILQIFSRKSACYTVQFERIFFGAQGALRGDRLRRSTLAGACWGAPSMYNSLSVAGLLSAFAWAEAGLRRMELAKVRKSTKDEPDNLQEFIFEWIFPGCAKA